MKLTIIGTTGHAFSMRRYLKGISLALAEYTEELTVLSCKRVGNPLIQLIHKYVLFGIKGLAVPRRNVKLLISERYAYLLLFTGFSRSAVVCHDLHTLHPEQAAGSLSTWMYRQQIHLMARAAVTICVSEHTKKDLLAFFPSYPEEKIKVVHNGIEDLWYQEPGQVVPDSFKSVFGAKKVILSVGTDAWYKNFRLALSILQDLTPEYVMLRIGPISTDSMTIIKQEGLEERLIQMMNVSDQDLKYSYEHAHCLLFPSQSEGFGWPVAEAMACRCPIVTSGKASIAELLEDPQDFCNDKEEYIAFIGQLSDPAIRDTLIEKGEIRSRQFSWKNTAENMSRVLREL